MMTQESNFGLLENNLVHSRSSRSTCTICKEDTRKQWTVSGLRPTDCTWQVRATINLLSFGLSSLFLSSLENLKRKFSGVSLDSSEAMSAMLWTFAGQTTLIILCLDLSMVQPSCGKSVLIKLVNLKLSKATRSLFKESLCTPTWS
jgi:hypothetical protein